MAKPGRPKKIVKKEIRAILKDIENEIHKITKEENKNVIQTMDNFTIG